MIPTISIPSSPPPDSSPHRAAPLPPETERCSLPCPKRSGPGHGVTEIRIAGPSIMYYGRLYPSYSGWISWHKYLGYWKGLYNDFDKEHYPNAESQYSRTISIPLFPDMTEEQSDYVIEVITKIGNENRI